MELCKKNGFDCPENDLDEARQSMLYARDNPDDRTDRITALVRIECFKDEGVCVLAVPQVPWTEEPIANVYLDFFWVRRWDDRGIDADWLSPQMDDTCQKDHPKAEHGNVLRIAFSKDVDNISEIEHISCAEERVFQLVDDDEHRYTHTFDRRKLGLRAH